MRKFSILMLGLSQVLMACIITYFLYFLWSTTSNLQEIDELDLLLIVILCGALGSFIHSATSFSSYLGNRNLGSQWIWWYILRPFIGSAIALILYFVFRSGFNMAEIGPKGINVFGIAALSGLAGMFSKQAVDKLKDIFDNMFKTERGTVDDGRNDKLENSNESDIKISK